MLLVHGILHLLGFDHEIGAEESIAMAEAERYILSSLQWKVQASKLPSLGLASAIHWTLSSGHFPRFLQMSAHIGLPRGQ